MLHRGAVVPAVALQFDCGLQELVLALGGSKVQVRGSKGQVRGSKGLVRGSKVAVRGK